MDNLDYPHIDLIDDLIVNLDSVYHLQNGFMVTNYLR